MKKEVISPVTEEEWSQVDDFNRKITEEFLAESMQLSPNTLKQYESGLKIYFRYIKDFCNNKKNIDIKGRDYLKYQNYLTRLGLSSNAVKFKRACISSLNGYIY